MDSLNLNTATLAISLFIFIFWETSKLTRKEVQAIYEKRKEKLSFKLDGWVFGLVWSILYALLYTSAWFFLINPIATTNNGQYIGIFVAFFVNVVLQKMWMEWFFDSESPKIALVMLFGILASGIVYIVLTAYNSLWISFGCFLPVFIWCCFALVLNIQWIWGEQASGSVEYEKAQIKSSTSFGRSPLKVPTSPFKRALNV